MTNSSYTDMGPTERRPSAAAGTGRVPVPAPVPAPGPVAAELRRIRHLLTGLLVAGGLLLLGLAGLWRRVEATQERVEQLPITLPQLAEKRLRESGIQQRADRLEASTKAMEARMEQAVKGMEQRLQESAKVLEGRMAGAEKRMIQSLETEVPKILDKYVERKMRAIRPQ